MLYNYNTIISPKKTNSFISKFKYLMHTQIIPTVARIFYSIYPNQSPIKIDI